MIALRFDGKLRLEVDAPSPQREGEALIQVLCAGICNTDLEIAKGYAGFHGVLGHEFVGRVVSAPDGALIGKRVAGEINVGCGACPVCRTGDSRHCPSRTVLGIKGRDGAFAEYLSLPTRNLVAVPDSISNETAVFIEPLAAACRILEQTPIDSSSDVALIGDGKLAQLVVRVLARTGCKVTVFGKHRDKLNLAAPLGVECVNVAEAAEPFPLQSWGGRFDVVIEASGSACGLNTALYLVRAQGVVVLKSTHDGVTQLDAAKIVVNEVVVIGSRCGRFAPAVDLLDRGKLETAALISDFFPLEAAEAAFARAAEPGVLKVVIQTAAAADLAPRTAFEPSFEVKA